MLLRSLALGVSLVAGLAVSGCGAGSDESEGAPIDVAREAIKGGYADPDDTAVVDIVWLETGYFSECTGSLIAPNLVLTARHCVAEMLNGSQGVDCAATKFTAPAAPAKFFVSTKQFLVLDAQHLKQDFRGVIEVITPEPTLLCGNDVALLVLDGSIDPAEAIPLVPRVDTILKKSELYSAVGFGGTVQEGTNAGQRRRLDKLLVNCVGDKCPSEYFSYLKPETEWLGDHGICQGDSGGPSLDPQNRVTGVTSRGGPGCTSPVYGSVFAWADWLKQNALHAADVGGYPAAPWTKGFSSEPQFNYPIGATCGDPPACGSGLCLADAVGSYCTRLCADNAPCDDGYDCIDIQGTKLCERPPPPELTSGSGGGGSGGSTMEESGCSAAGADPTKPVPWRTGAVIAAAGLALLRRRRGRTTFGR